MAPVSFVLLWLLLIVLAALLIVICTKTHIGIIIRRDPDMPTIKQRLAALESAVTGHDSNFGNVAMAADVQALSNRVGAVEAEIGTDDQPQAAATTESTLVLDQRLTGEAQQAG